MVADPRRQVPRTDVLLADPRLAEAAGRLGGARLKATVVAVQQLIRAGELAPADAVPAVLARLPGLGQLAEPGAQRHRGGAAHQPRPGPPAAGGAGRPWSRPAGYTDVEYDLATGQRARRGAARWPRWPSGAGGRGRAGGEQRRGGAAARGHRAGRRPRGGDQPRRAGRDRRRVPAAGPDRSPPARGSGRWAPPTAPRWPTTRAAARARDRVHAQGPPQQLPDRRLHRRASASPSWPPRVPVVADIGSGLLRPDPLLPDEPDADTALRAGAALVTGQRGQAARRAAGRADPRRGPTRRAAAPAPLARALRVDKLTLAAFEATPARPATPTWRYLHADPASCAGAASGRVLAGAGRAAPDDCRAGRGACPATARSAAAARRDWRCPAGRWPCPSATPSRCAAATRPSSAGSNAAAACSTCAASAGGLTTRAAAVAGRADRRCGSHGDAVDG